MRLTTSRCVLWLAIWSPLAVCAHAGAQPGVQPHQGTDLVLGCWSAPRNLDLDYFRLLTDLGFTHTLYWRSRELQPNQWKRDLDRAEKAGLKLIFDSWQPDAVPEAWLDAVLATACLHPAFAGVYAPDEPGYRLPIEPPPRRPSIERHESAARKIQACGRGVFFQVDAAAAPEESVSRFLPFSTAFGLDIYPYKAGIDWRERIRKATHTAARLAGRQRSLWMVLQGHGRADWYEYATGELGLTLPVETDPRPSPSVLVEMGKIAIENGADGIWWWSFELYDWRNSEHRRFIRAFRGVNQNLASAARKEKAPPPTASAHSER